MPTLPAKALVSEAFYFMCIEFKSHYHQSYPYGRSVGSSVNFRTRVMKPRVDGLSSALLST